jgi:anti-sigma regulatory factor (Ser/Thr protein kinase)
LPPATWSWPAVDRTVSVARAAVSGYLKDAGTPDPPLEDIRLALSEAVTNTILHAYIEAPDPGEVRVRVELTHDEVVVVVEDAGRGLLPRADSPGGGLGLPLIAALADSVETLKSAAGGTCLTMRFKRDPAAATLL